MVSYAPRVRANVIPSTVQESRAERVFQRLGRLIIRRPWAFVATWIVLLIVAIPALTLLNGATGNSATNLPASAPSSIASAKIAQEFPNASVQTASYVLLVGPNITGSEGQAAILALSRSIGADRSLIDVAGIQSLYSAYAAYLEGQTTGALGVLGPALQGSPSLPQELNATAGALWGPPARFVATWQGLVASNPSTPPSQFNFPAYNSTRTAVSSNATLVRVLDAFYAGSTGAGFNGTAACAQVPSRVVPCSDGVARFELAPIVPSLFGTGAGTLLGPAVLTDLGVENFTQWTSLQGAGAGYLAVVSGEPPSWIRACWSAFPSAVASTAQVRIWVANLVDNGTISTYPLPIPSGIWSSFVSPDGSAELLVVEYSAGTSDTSPNGSVPVYEDVRALNSIIPSALASVAGGSNLAWYQTGPAALDEQESTDLNATIALVLPLTVLTLITITMLYFRAPLAPLVTFGGLGISLVLGLGAVVLVGNLITKVDSTSLALVETFVLGVGTDYAIFLVARYREELDRGQEPDAALLTTVTWAGQSVATSGATAVIATLALAFSGVTLLDQWGMVLSISVLITVLMSLTFVPAALVLLRRRIFWPYTGARGERRATRVRELVAAQSTYYFRAGRFSQRRPWGIVGVITLVCVPLAFLALTAPIAYDFYGQLPSNQGASRGSVVFQQQFGSGTMFPFQALVTFSSPLLVGNSTNVTEFTDLASLGSAWTNTSGVASLHSPVGTYGASLSAWAFFSGLPAATRANLRAVLAPYLGADGSSVLLTVYSKEGGLSYAAVSTLLELQGGLPGIQAAHPSITGAYFSGGAATTHDLSVQTQAATVRMLLLVSIGLLIVLFVILRSWAIPLFALATILLSVSWALGLTSLALTTLAGLPLFFFVPTVMIILILGLGTDYNIFLLTRIREERLRGRPNSEAIVSAVGSTGGIITAAAVILASAFAILIVGNFTLLRSIGFGVAIAVLLDALVVRTYLVPASLRLFGERVWDLRLRRPGPPKVRSESRPSE